MRPAVREKKSLSDSESLPVVQQQTHIRPISWSKPIRDSEGPSDWPWSRYSCTCVYICKSVCCCSQTEREVSRDARSVTNFNIIASVILHANIAEITAQELSLSCLVCII